MAKGQQLTPGKNESQRGTNRMARIRWLLEKDDGLEIVSGLIRTAAMNGDMVAAKMWMQYVIPASKLSDETLEGCEHLSRLPPDRRLEEVNCMVASGTLPVEYGKVLCELVNAEMEAQVLKKIRKMQKLIERGADIGELGKLIKSFKVGKDASNDNTNYVTTAEAVVVPDDYKPPEDFLS